jgi:hypothetical protein
MLLTPSTYSDALGLELIDQDAVVRPTESLIAQTGVDIEQDSEEGGGRYPLAASRHYISGAGTRPSRTA